MTISKGSEWGVVVERPADLRIASDDADLARMLTDGSGRPTAVASGDLLRTIGAPPLGERIRLNAFPIDLIDLTIDETRTVPAVAHVVGHLPMIRGGWLRGRVFAVMNAEFIGDFDVAPRGHPNDGRLDSVDAEQGMSVRQRLAVRTRLRNASHLPHPQIVTRSSKHVEFVGLARLRIDVDGRSHGTASHVSVRVRPDAAVLYA